MSPNQYLTLIDTIARFKLRAEARKYFFGYLWWILEPMLYVAVFYVVFEELLGTREPNFLAFLIVGKLTFIWFSKSVTQASVSLGLNQGVIGQLKLPLHLFPMSVLHDGLYRQTAVFIFLVIFLFGAGYSPNQTWLWLVPIMVTQYCLIIACGLSAALLVSAQRDFQLLVSLGMVFLLFMSGVFWDIRSIQDPVVADWLLILNPLATLIDAYRQVLMWGVSPDPSRLIWVLIEAGILTLVMFWAFSRLHYWIARRTLDL